MMVAQTIRTVGSVLLRQPPYTRFERATILTLPPSVLANKTLLVAVLLLARHVARSLGLSPDCTVADAGRDAAVNRTYVYELAHKLIAALVDLTSASPGRPPRPEPTPDETETALRLQVAVLRYRLENPGAVISAGGGRTQYSPGFRRFVLGRLDAWRPARDLESFALAAEVPLDTLRDWVEAERKGLTPELPPEPPSPRLPREPTALVVAIAERFAAWQGSTRAFLADASRHFRLLPGQVYRVLRLLDLVHPRRSTPTPPRYRGSTEPVAPGSVLVIDGKSVVVELTGSGRREVVVLHEVVDQATACRVGRAIAPTENAASGADAVRQGKAFLGGRAPDAVLHDNKPCYEHEAFRAAVAPARVIPATLARPENKAVIEGTFGLFAQQVGVIRLDDTNSETLVASAVAEVSRAWDAAANHAPRPEYDGKSRARILGESRPSMAQLERDRRFLERLEARHRSGFARREVPISRTLVDEAFVRWELAPKDPDGALRRYLATFSPEAVRRALALFAAKRASGRLDAEFAHRYLAKLVRSSQDEVELEIAERELLDLSRRQREIWTAAEEEDLAGMRQAAASSRELVPRIAERAAHAGIPVEGAFWEEALVAELRRAPEAREAARLTLVRLYEAPVERRLALLAKIAAVAEGLG